MNRDDLGSENKAIIIDTANFMEATVKGDVTQQRKRLMDALDRLKGCMAETKVETNGTSYTEAAYPLYIVV
jgi:hypothetical protein